jgi:hypothetical protein
MPATSTTGINLAASEVTAEITNGSESYVRGAVNTDPTPGVRVDQVALWSAGEAETSSPELLIDNTNGGKGGFIASRFSVFGELTGLEGKLYWNGGWTCVNPLNLYFAGFSQDLAPTIGC